MKTLIVYYSFTHNNELLAKHIQQKLSCDIHRIEEFRERRSISILFDLMFHRSSKINDCPYYVSSYDQCIFIAPVWAGKIATPLRSFLLREKCGINQYSFITICGGVSGQKEKLFRQLTKLVERKPRTMTELWVNDLLSEEKKNTIKNTSGYRIKSSDLETFNEQIENFIKSIQNGSRLEIGPVTV